VLPANGNPLVTRLEPTAAASTPPRQTVAPPGDNLISPGLRQIDCKLSRLTDDVQDLKRWMSSVEDRLAGVSRQLDRLEDRLLRVHY
jgi:hypothetical protein